MQIYPSSVGDRVYVTGGYGTYASYRNISADLAVQIPDNVSDDTAASNFLRAMTVAMLTGRYAEYLQA